MSFPISAKKKIYAYQYNSFMKAKNKTLFIEGVKGVVDETKRQIIGVIGSTGVIDRQGESINPMGWQLGNYLKNPVLLYGHNYSSLPIGKATRVYVENGELKFDLEFADTEMGNEVFTLFEGKYLNAFSVGFIPKKWGVSGVDQYDIMEQELLELSAVPVPANPEALSYLKENAPSFCKSMGIKVETEKKDVAETVEIAYLLGNLNWLIECFKQNGVSEEATNKMTEAMAILLDVMKMEAEVGVKAFEAKSGRILSKKNESAIKSAVETLTGVLSSLEDEKDADEVVETPEKPVDTPIDTPPVDPPVDPIVPPVDGLNEETQKLLKEMSDHFKESDKNIGQGLSMLKSLKSALSVTN